MEAVVSLSDETWSRRGNRGDRCRYRRVSTGRAGSAHSNPFLRRPRPRRRRRLWHLEAPAPTSCFFALGASAHMFLLTFNPTLYPLVRPRGPHAHLQNAVQSVCSLCRIWRPGIELVKCPFAIMPPHSAARCLARAGGALCIGSRSIFPRSPIPTE